MLDNQTYASDAIRTIYDNYPQDIRHNLLLLRQLILEVAQEDPAIGALQETLKWGQISYLPTKAKIGTTIRLDQVKDTSQYALYVPCSTTLLDTFRRVYADTFIYEGDRAIVFNLDDELPIDAVKECIHRALTYHLAKKQA